MLDDIALQASTRPQQALSWVGHLNLVVGEIRDGKTKMTAGWFWVRLYGLLAELTPNYRRQRSLLETIAPDHECLPLLQDVCNALDAVHDKFTKKELIFVEYMRHCQSHVFQNSYYRTVTNDIRALPSAPYTFTCRTCFFWVQYGYGL